MSGSWDTAIKIWVGVAPQDLVSWLLGDAVYDEEAQSHLINRSVDADLLYRVHSKQRKFILHVEFQSTSHRHMPERMWEYNVYATIKYQVPVHSFVIYLKKGKEKDNAFAQPPLTKDSAFGDVMHYFAYNVIKMWEVPTDALLNSSHKGLLPLVPLTTNGGSEAVEQALERLNATGKEPETELISSLYVLGSMVYNNEDWFERRFAALEHILKDSWAYKKWTEQGLQQGLQQGQEQGLQQGREQGLQQGRRQDIVSLVQKQFPSLTALAQERVARLTTPEKLQGLLLQVAMAKDEQEVRSSLLEVREEH